jgi:hypothetical protein
MYEQIIALSKIQKCRTEFHKGGLQLLGEAGTALAPYAVTVP